MRSREYTTVEHDGLGGFERRQFQIAANGQAFRTLIDGLYSNKIGAVVRELWSNAVDSHVEANQELPFLVEVPTMLEPTFRIRDYGVSLSHEDVMGLYSTIFQSTKGESNLAVGKFGLGSKSPFAYGDTFIVIAYLDGLKRTYVANIMNDGMPEIRHLSTELTDEPQGFEVSIPVASGDFRNFEREVIRMLLATDQRPAVVGLSIDVPEPVLSGDGWRIFDRTYDMGNFAVRQGCVMYPVNTVYPHIASDHLFVADVPIGACEVTASRESLSMDPETYQAVQDAHARAWAGVKAFVAGLTYENRLDEFQRRNQYSFIEGIDRKDHLSLTPDKPNKNVPARTVLTYNSERVTKPEWVSYFSRPEGVHVIVDDIRPGEKFLRRNLRLREYAKAHSRHDRTVLVTREELPRLVRVLGLTAEQVIPMSTLPDVTITRNYNGNGRVAGGVTGTAAPRELPAESFWVRKHGAVSLAPGAALWNRVRGDLGAMGKTTDFWGQVNYLLTTLGFQQDQIVFLTEGQSNKFDPTGAQRLTTEVQKRAIKYAADHNFSTRFVGSQNTEVFNNEFPTWRSYNSNFGITDVEAHSLIRSRVRDELGLASDDYQSPTSADDQIAEFAGITFTATLTLAEIKSKVDEYKKVYPLLFQGGGQSLIDFYIQTTDELENHK